MGKEILVAELARQLQLAADERRAAKAEPALAAARLALKRYQSGRMADTHAELLASPDTHGAAQFFLDELYSAKDLSRRDADLARIVPALQKMLPYEALHTIADAVVLDALSERLDTAMARVLGARFTEDMYIAAYRSATAQQERSRQLDLVQQLGESLCVLVNTPLLSVALSLMRAPARLAGLGELHRFLDRGFTTFKAMPAPARFVAAIMERERRVMANIYAGRSAPFDTF